MTSESYLEILYHRLERHFSIERGATPLDERLALYARCRQDLGRTLISQKDVIDRFWEEEIILVRSLVRVGREDVAAAAAMLKRASEELVEADWEHRLSVVSAVLVAREGIDPDAARDASRYRWGRSYKFCFHGFAEGRMALVDCASETLVPSPQFKRSVRAFGPRPADIS